MTRFEQLDEKVEALMDASRRAEDVDFSCIWYRKAQELKVIQYQMSIDEAQEDKYAVEQR